MRRSRPCSAWRRRAFARSSAIEPLIESSMKILDWLSSSIIEPTRAKSSSVKRPVLIFHESTARSEQNMRSTSCSLDISSDMTPTDLSVFATFWAMLRAREVLPIEGRAARTTRSAG